MEKTNNATNEDIFVLSDEDLDNVAGGRMDISSGSNYHQNNSRVDSNGNIVTPEL